jgi:hypothetical protein
MNSLYAATRAKVKKGYLITKEILEGLIEQKNNKRCIRYT